MPVDFGQRRFMSKTVLDSGQLISFGYKGRVRYAVVIAPEYKENCDCYVFEDLREIPEEVLRYIYESTRLKEGELWEVFGNVEERYRSFKRRHMLAIQSIEFVIYNENELTIETKNEKTQSPTDRSGPSNQDL